MGANVPDSCARVARSGTEGAFELPVLRSDIFSLGAILYYLVCEAEPFGSDVEFEVLNNTLQCKYTSPLFVAPMVSMQTVQDIDGALKRSPGERWPNVEALIAALG